ncbi:MAG: hypothetical protein V3T23_03030 [Nitrososphaerales archaeon]
MHKNFIVTNFGYRIQSYHPKSDIQMGMGNTDADILVVQPHQKMPERDAITGALKNFGMLGDAYRATSMIVDFSDAPLATDPTTQIEYPDLIRQNRRGEKLSTGPEINRRYLLELIEMVRPLVVVACGLDATTMLRKRKIRSFDSIAGKKFQVEDLTSCVFYATLDPTSYGFARAAPSLKAQGKQEWTKLAEIYTKLKEQREKDRWAS